MLRFLHNRFRALSIGQKLFLGSLAFALPVAMLSFFMDISFRYDIQIGKKELAGTAYVRELFSFLTRVPEMHIQALEETLGGSGAGESTSLNSAGAAAYDGLLAVHAIYAGSLGMRPLTPAGTKTGPPLPEDLRTSWEVFKQEPAASENYRSIAQALLDSITRIGERSKLLMDPALDSAALAETLVRDLPGGLLHLMEIQLVCNEAASAGSRMSLEPAKRDRLLQLTALAQSDFQRILENSRTALREDPDYYSEIPSFQAGYSRALLDYEAAFRALSGSLGEFISGKEMRLADGELRRLASPAASALGNLFDVGVGQLDLMIASRIASYSQWRFMGAGFSAAALAAAILLVFSIGKSITLPIDAIIAYTRKVSGGIYEASPANAFGGELADLSRHIHGMVSDLQRLAAFPLENPNPVLRADPEGEITYRNPAAEALSRYPGSTVMPPGHREIVAATLTTRQAKVVEHRVGERIYLWNYFPVSSSEAVHIYVQDITERKRAEERLKHDALHDGLTGLPNRTLFQDRLGQVIRRAKRDPEYFFAVLVLDMDRFKHVNDSLGHHVGDKLLVALTERLSPLIRSQDTMARLGGDEFAILQDNISAPKNAVRLVKRLQKELGRVFIIDGNELFASMSVGIACGGRNAERPEDLLRDADTAMYRAKSDGRSGFAIFDKQMHTETLHRLHMEMDLKRAVERHEFVVFYQPIVSASHGGIHGFEALVRWKHPKRGLVPPGEFIPLAEETGLIVPIGMTVLREACRQVGAWQRNLAGHEDLQISVNLSVRQFGAAGLAEEIGRILKETGLSPKALKLEVTESGIMKDVERSLALFARLKEMDILLGIDDFGTGYSSMSYLHRFPFDFLKVDRSFVGAMEQSNENLKIVKSIIALGHELGKGITAEGVDGAAQIELLRRLGCDLLQGFYFSRPVAAEEAERLLRENPDRFRLTTKTSS